MPFDRALAAEELARRRALAAQGQAAPPGIHALQQTAGNRAVSHLVAQEQSSQTRDSLSELGEEQQSRMQMIMERTARADAAKSNTMKKQSDTSSEIIGNMK